MQNTPYGFCHCGCGEPAPLARQTDSARGFIKGEPLRFVAQHHSKGRRRPLESMYVVEDRGYKTPCWIWQGGKTEHGYGVVRDGGRSRGAHCVFYEQAGGVIPDGWDVHHECRVKSCVNPDHLEAITHAENVWRDRRHTIPEEIVVAIRSAEGSHASVARRYGVSKSYVCDVRRGRVRTTPLSV